MTFIKEKEKRENGTKCAEWPCPVILPLKFHVLIV
jgi:hypothetical protein